MRSSVGSLRAGCGGFPVARSTYFLALDTVEVGGFAGLPRPETAERWRREAPRGFVVAVVCSRAVTGALLRPTAEVREGWEATLRVARAVQAGFIVLETPPAFYANGDHLRDMYALLRAAERAEAVLVWQPARAWDAALAGKVCRDLRLVRAVDPLVEAPPEGGLNYFRLRGGGEGRKPSRGHRYSDAELKTVLERAGGRPTYAFFLTAEGWRDSRRLAALARPMPKVGPGRVRY
ncbi:MAG: DUF72 domain-containing protein [Elusimicrobia bacterium]|nr:DUF72 domain-containing protein [Elusimicrobiota bacterium]